MHKRAESSNVPRFTEVRGGGGKEALVLPLNLHQRVQSLLSENESLKRRLKEKSPSLTRRSIGANSIAKAICDNFNNKETDIEIKDLKHTVFA